MFCPLHSSISIQEQHNKAPLQSIQPLSIHPAIMKNIEDLLVMHAPHISMHESHNALISAILSSFHNIIAVRSVSAIFVSHTEAIIP